VVDRPVNALDFGREVTRDLAVADSREWLCTNGKGGFASGTVAGPLAPLPRPSRRSPHTASRPNCPRYPRTVEMERGLDWVDDNLLAGRFAVTLGQGEALTLTCSCEAEPSLDGEAAWRRRQVHEAELLTTWRQTP